LALLQITARFLHFDTMITEVILHFSPAPSVSNLKLII
jgi:hypothetical protein